MKYAATLAILFVIALAGSAVWAECGSCAAPMPPPCPSCVAPAPVCQPPCPTPCPQSCCTAAIPAAVGAGPQLAGIECPNFDPAYARSIYQQYATIAGVTEFGMQRVSDKNLRDISGEIHDYMVSANQKVAAAFSNCGCLNADQTQAQAIISELCAQSGHCFDVTYAKTLSTLIRQAKSADDLAATKSMNSTLKEQAQFLSGKEDDWAMRLDRWVTEHP